MGLTLIAIFVGNMNSAPSPRLPTTPRCVVDVLEGRDAIQRHLDRIEQWAHEVQEG